MRKKDIIINIIKYIIISIIAFFVIIIPIWMTVINSFKSAKEVTSLNMSLPIDWSIIRNYSIVFVEGKFLQGLLNSLLYTFISVILIILIASLASWTFARSKSKISKILYFISISGVLIPPAIISTIRIERVLHLYGTYAGMILFYIGVFSPIVIFFTTGFIKTIPLELEEAAKVDGARPIQVFFKIVFPLLRPVQLTSIIFVTVFIWNDFIYPFYLTNKSRNYPMTLGLYYFFSKYWNNPRWELIFTDVVIISLPIVILFIFAHKQITSGIMSGAIKG